MRRTGLSRLAKKPVSRLVSQCVIYALKIVNVEVKDGNALTLGEARLHKLRVLHLVVKTGQVVVLAVVDDLLAEKGILDVELKYIEVQRIHPVSHGVVGNFDIKSVRIIRDSAVSKA